MLYGVQFCMLSFSDQELKNYSSNSKTGSPLVSIKEKCYWNTPTPIRACIVCVWFHTQQSWVRFPDGASGKNLLANAGDLGDVGSIPVSGRYPGGGNGNTLQYSSLGNPMDRRAWQAAVHGVARNQIWQITFEKGGEGLSNWDRNVWPTRSKIFTTCYFKERFCHCQSS